jgi:hypothetical protein
VRVRARDEDSGQLRCRPPLNVVLGRGLVAGLGLAHVKPFTDLTQARVG